MGLTNPNPKPLVTSALYQNTAFRADESGGARPSAPPPYESLDYELDITTPLIGGSQPVPPAGRVRRIIRSATMTWASSTCIIIYTFMMLYMIYVNGGVEPMNVNPMVGPSLQVLNEFGANNAAEIKYNKQYWRFITPIFLHAGLIHLAFNVCVQWRLGTDLEAMWGTPKWLAIFLISGAAGNLASCIFLPTVIGVGASGSLMGMLGGWMLELVCHWSDDTPGRFLAAEEAKAQRKQRIRNLVCLGFTVLLTFLLSIVPMVDWAAHVGGCIAGMILGAHLFSVDVRGKYSRRCTLAASAILLIGLAIISLIVFFRDIDPCPDKDGEEFTDYIPPKC